MADAKISGLTNNTAPVAADLIPHVDVSDTTMAATGTDKKTTLGDSFQALIDNFQADTTNASVAAPRIEIGWGVMAISNAGGANYHEAVTFHTAFSAKPIVLITPGGDALTAAGTGYGNGSNTISATWYSKATDITTSGFNAYLDSATAPGASGYVWYQWMAIGPA